MAGEGAEHERCIPDGTRERSDVLKAPAETKHVSVLAHPTKGRLEAHDARECRWDANGPSQVGSYTRISHTQRHGYRGSTARPTGRIGRPPGIERRVETYLAGVRCHAATNA